MSYEEDSPNIYPFYEVSTIYSGFELLSRSPEIFFFIFFIHLHLFDCVSLLYSQVAFLFSEHSDFFLHLVVLSLLSCVVFRFSLLVRCIFLCKIPSLCHEWIYHCLYWVPNSFSFLQRDWCHPCTLWNWSFLAKSMRSSGIIAITNNNDDSSFPWNIPHWNFNSAKLLSTITSTV